MKQPSVGRIVICLNIAHLTQGGEVSVIGWLLRFAPSNPIPTLAPSRGEGLNAESERLHALLKPIGKPRQEAECAEVSPL